jgi:S-methyl-5-thioribose-1-phosphate isomerase
LGEAVQRLKASASALAAAGASGADAAEQIIKECEAMLADDVAANRAIGAFGADALCAAVGKAPGAPLRVLTHCNTGSLATAGYGTALGVVRALRESDRLEHIYCNETRPYNQGARLTAYEIAFEKMPGTLICDSAAASLMAQKKVDAVVVGADRVADNGDTANKIGTYNLAVSCAYHGVPFFVAAPVSTLDPSTKKGDDIVIEDRPAEEITHVRGVRGGQVRGGRRGRRRARRARRRARRRRPRGLLRDGRRLRAGVLRVQAHHRRRARREG